MAAEPHKNDHLKYDEEFKKIFLENYNPLCNYARGFLNDSEAAEDVVQNLFIQLWERNALISVQNKEHYLLRSTKLKCIDYLRHRSSKREIILPEFPEKVIESKSEISEEDIEPMLLYFASKLPPKTCEVFLLSRQSKLTYAEIANELGLSVKTVENQMGRALKQMRQLLKAHHFISLIPFL